MTDAALNTPSNTNGSAELAIVARDVGVKYDLRLRKGMTLRRIAGSLLRGHRPGGLGRNEFWALQGVSFAVERGDVLAVVGSNGSGKSTLLQTIAGVLRPDAGAVTTFGCKPTLLAVGAGFEPDLSGRENIYLNAAYLGFSRRKIEEHLEEIIAFSELGRFVDAPVRTYSKGMRTRLGFSVAAHLEPQLLLLDEALGFGDANFKRKSREKLDELMDLAHAIVVVSHTAGFVTSVATKALWLEGGKLAASGEPEDVMERYTAATEGRRGPVRAVA